MGMFKKLFIIIGAIAFISVSTIMGWATEIGKNVTLIWVCITSGIGLSATIWSYYLFIVDYKKIHNRSTLIWGYFPTMYLYLLACNGKKER